MEDKERKKRREIVKKNFVQSVVWLIFIFSTLIIISHRHTLIDAMDRVLTIKNGNVVDISKTEFETKTEQEIV